MSVQLQVVHDHGTTSRSTVSEARQSATTMLVNQEAGRRVDTTLNFDGSLRTEVYLLDRTRGVWVSRGVIELDAPTASMLPMGARG
jgi:hypothetical protein